MNQSFIEQLIAALPDHTLVTGDAIDAKYWHDWSGLPPVRPLALLRPRTAQDISAAMVLCNAAGVAVVPQGGLPGLAGGAHPIAGCVVLSLELLAGIEEIDTVMGTMTVLAGTP